MNPRRAGLNRWCASAFVLAMIVLLGTCAAPETDQPQPQPEVVEVPESEVQVVRVGLERLAKGEDEVIRGKRLGLIVHAASVTAEGRHAIDVLSDLDLDVVRLFSPEHGLRGRAAAGEQARGRPRR